MKKPRTRHLKRAIKASGGVSSLARALGLTRAAVSIWHDVPLKHILAIAKHSGLSPSSLRPDFFRAAGVDDANK